MQDGLGFLLFGDPTHRPRGGVDDDLALCHGSEAHCDSSGGEGYKILNKWWKCGANLLGMLRNEVKIPRKVPVHTRRLLEGCPKGYAYRSNFTRPRKHSHGLWHYPTHMS
jgi:hypothetical protein